MFVITFIYIDWVKYFVAINSRFLRNNKFMRRMLSRLAARRAYQVVEHIKQYLRPADRILDFGAGACCMCDAMRKQKYKVTPVDVKNLSFVDSIKPIIYDGKRLPFKKNQFDVSLLIFVLHHTPHPEKTLAEAARVSKRIIIMEDTYTNSFHKHVTFFLDSLLNQEFRGHPHSNKTDKQWKALFKKSGLKLKDFHNKLHFFVMKHTTYYLEK